MDSYFSVKVLEKNHYEVGNMWLTCRKSVVGLKKFQFLLNLDKTTLLFQLSCDKLLSEKSNVFMLFSLFLF